MMQRFNGMMKNLGRPLRFQDGIEISHGRFQYCIHGAGNPLGIKKVIVSLEKTYGASIFFLCFDQALFTASQQTFVCRQQRNEIVGSDMKVGLSFFELFPVRSYFVNAGAVF